MYVVYLLTPTSNHNTANTCKRCKTLYIFWLLHQTTTVCLILLILLCCISFDSYIKPQLAGRRKLGAGRCISFDSYIKPQLKTSYAAVSLVVYLLTPTSNHNVAVNVAVFITLHIFWLLHQTTTCWRVWCPVACCISFDSYIKPQPMIRKEYIFLVVYLLTPTSNHNVLLLLLICKVLYIFWLLHQTTTTEPSSAPVQSLYIFWLLHQTTTDIQVLHKAYRLYIFWLLHQTTTAPAAFLLARCCISFDSYIKPQRRARQPFKFRVVYLLTPTSNHNHLSKQVDIYRLYIFWLLHQTTTYSIYFIFSLSCISFDSYIKPQLDEYSF